MRLLGVCVLLALTADVFAESSRPAWNTSRVLGWPDPPPYRTRPIFEKLSFIRPLYIIAEPGSDRLWVVEQAGRIVSFPDDPNTTQLQEVLKLSDADTYGVAFHPNFATNRYFYVFSNGPNSAKKRRNQILRYRLTPIAPHRAEPGSETLIIEWESNGHNGGDLAFGQDGMLYLTAGDGTNDSDGDLTGQDLRDLCGGIIRIDVDNPEPGRAYRIPKDNPFVGKPGARGENYALGMRNPWRMHIDRVTGVTYVADIGQDMWEMIHVLQRGGNYGWSLREGSHPFYLNRKAGPGEFLKPIIEHPHSESRSITGGVVYRGKRFPELQGAYLYGDYSTGKVWGLRYNSGRITWSAELATSRAQILGFGTGRDGEVYIADYLGQIHTLEPMPALSTGPFPRRLSETGLFTNTAEHRLHPGVVPYFVNSPLWSDGADKSRFIALPGTTKIGYKTGWHWDFPEGTVLVKTFTLPTSQGPRRIETRLMALTLGQWYGYSYRWDESQQDAELVAANGRDEPILVCDEAGERRQVWHYPSRAECMVCHTRAAGFVLGVRTEQLNRKLPNGEHQLTALAAMDALEVPVGEHHGAIDHARNEWLKAFNRPLVPVDLLLGSAWRTPMAHRLEPLSGLIRRSWNAHRETLRRSAQEPQYRRALPRDPAFLPRLADPYNEAEPLSARARSYLQANCAHCHVWAGGGNSAIDLRYNINPKQMNLIDVEPLHDKFGIVGAKLIASGEPNRSVLLYRVTTTGTGKMPPLSRSLVDQPALDMLRRWVQSLPASP